MRALRVNEYGEPKDVLHLEDIDPPTPEPGQLLVKVRAAAQGSLERRVDLQPGETLLVHAAAGGVGSATVQMGKVIGARVIAAAGGREKEDVCRALGADAYIDSRNDDVIARVLEETDGRGADVVFDPVGGDAFEQSRKCTAVDGRILVVGFASGTIPKLSLHALLYRGYAVLGAYVGDCPRT